MTNQTPTQRNEGEGNRTAARAYNKDTQAFVQSGKVDDAARKAAKALNSAEGADLKRAEAEAKSHAKGENPARKK